MATEITIDPGPRGKFFVVTRDTETLSEHRKPIDPGHWEGDTWYDTDLTDAPDEAKAYAAGAWTPEVVAEFKDWSKPEPVVPAAADVEAERARRLALGFDFDFGDERGVHRIGTTPADMIGWDEVTTIANAMLLAGVDLPIMIETEGAAEPIAITAAEWQQVLLAAAAFRQPIWLASFALAKMDPIPADYADDAYWSA